MLFDKTFSQLTTTELFQIYRLRAAVFIVAQSRVVQDPDDVDLIARHIFIKDGDAIVAYARVYPADGGVSFGRVVTAASHRGQPSRPRTGPGINGWRNGLHPEIFPGKSHPYPRPRTGRTFLPPVGLTKRRGTVYSRPNPTR